MLLLLCHMTQQCLQDTISVHSLLQLHQTAAIDLQLVITLDLLQTSAFLFALTNESEVELLSTLPLQLKGALSVLV